MIAFEIWLNGKRLYTCGAGDVGRLSFSVDSLGIQTDRGPSHEHTRAFGSAIHPGISMKWWQQIDELKVGDEISVRIVEVDECDPPEKDYPLPGKLSYATNMKRSKSKSNFVKPKDDEAFRLFPDDPDVKRGKNRRL